MTERLYSPGGTHGHIASPTSATGVLCGTPSARYWTHTPARSDRVTTCKHCDRLAGLPPIDQLIDMCRRDTRTVTARQFGLTHNVLDDYIQRHLRRHRPAPQIAPPIPDEPVGGDWMDRGLCVGGDPELWVGEDRNDRDKATRIREATRICRMCDVRNECLTDALTRHETWGVWGGVDMGVKDRPALAKVGAR